jgi:hypothetical protein
MHLLRGESIASGQMAPRTRPSPDAGFPDCRQAISRRII